MKIGIMVFGTDGEIEPSVVLARELAKANHQIELAIISIRNRDYSDLSMIKGLVLHQIPFPTEIIKKNFPSSEFWNFNDSEFNNYFDNQFKLIRNKYKRIAKKISENKDLIIGNRQSYPLRFSAELNKIPYLTICFEYVFIKSKLYPPLSDKVEGTYEQNSIAWEMTEDFANTNFLPELNEYRASNYGLPAVQNYFRDIVFSTELNLVTFSKHFFSEELDWDQIHHQCGFFIAQSRIDWEISDSLNSFICGGSKPILITLGSLIDFEDSVDTFLKVLVDAVQCIGERAIILLKENQVNHFGSDIFLLSGFVDHSKLIPQCKLVIHHGGAGTMHRVAVAGVPSLIIAYGFDQFRNANLLIKAGICKYVIARKELDAENLANAIRNSLVDINLVETAKVIGEKINQENGLIEAVRIIERKFSKKIE